MFIYILIALLLTATALIFERLTPRSQSACLWGWAIFLTLFAACRAAGVDPDSGDVYVRDLRHSLPFSQFFADPLYYVKHSPPPELLFCLLSSFLKSYFPSCALRVILVLFAVLCISKKVFTFKRLAATGTLGLVLLCYFVNFYLLHEMTQFRVGFALVFVLLSFPFALKRSFLPFCLLILVATLVHRSAFLCMLIYFFNPSGINIKGWLAAILVFFGLAVAGWDVVTIVSRIHIPVFSEKVADYIYLQRWIDVKGNPFNTFLMLQVLTSALCYCYRQKLAPLCPCFYLLLKANLLSILVFYVFFSLVGFSFRLNELFGEVQYLLLPMLIYVFRQRWVGQLFVVGVALCMLLFNLFHLDLLKPYQLCFF